MKIFWSWQSDTPGNVGRHFVREALEEALRQLKQEPTIEEPVREELHLDHDRKGVSGSPDLVATILSKIRESAIFIADVTPIGKSDVGESTKKRSLMNPNVAIELGYALATLSEQGLLMVMNEAFGDRESLPFDLRQKAGPIMFNLPPTANSNERKRIKGELAGILKVAIKECMQGLHMQLPSGSHDEIPSTVNAGQYFDDAEILNEREIEGTTIPLLYKVVPFIYLRVIPTTVMPPLRGAEITNLVYGIKVRPLCQNVTGGDCWGTNRYGGLTFAFVQKGKGGILLTSSQLFYNREIWGIDTTLLSRDSIIPSVTFEAVLENALKHYLQFGREHLNYRWPLIVEAGAARIQGYKMAMGQQYVNPYWGPAHHSEIRSRHILATFEERDVNHTLLGIFEDFFDAVMAERPKQFRDFPPLVDNTTKPHTA